MEEEEQLENHNNSNHNHNDNNVNNEFSDEDSWEPSPSCSLRLSLFKPHHIKIKFDDKTIEENLNKECNKPILNEDIFNSLDDFEEQEDGDDDKNEEKEEKRYKESTTKTTTTKTTKTTKTTIVYENNNQTNNIKITNNDKKNEKELNSRERTTCYDEEMKQNKTNKNDNNNKNNNNDEKQYKKLYEERQKEEALFNAVEDEENERWINKQIIKNNSNYNNKQNNYSSFKQHKLPLTCPKCFIQFCFSYEKIKSNEKNNENNHNNINNQNNQNNPINNNLNNNNNKEIEYHTNDVYNLKIEEYKIIRNRFCEEKMIEFPTNNKKTKTYHQQQHFNDNTKENENLNNLLTTITETIHLNNKEIDEYEEQLTKRIEEINIKFLVTCEQCELEIGFWDMNKECFILFNVI